MEEIKATKGIAKFDDVESMEPAAINRKLLEIKDNLPDINKDDPDMDAALRMMIRWHINPAKLLEGTKTVFSARDLDFMKMVTLMTGSFDFARRNILGKEYRVEDMVQLLFQYELNRRVPDLAKIEELIAQNKNLNERFELQTQFLRSKLDYERNLSEVKERYRIETANMERDIAAREKKGYEEKSAAYAEKISALEKSVSEVSEKFAILEKENSELKKKLADEEAKTAVLEEEKKKLEEKARNLTADKQTSQAAPVIMKAEPSVSKEEMDQLLSGIMADYEKKLGETISNTVVARIKKALAEQAAKSGSVPAPAQETDYYEEFASLEEKASEIIDLLRQPKQPEKKGFFSRLFASEEDDTDEEGGPERQNPEPDYDDVVEGLVKHGASEDVLALILYCMEKELPEKCIRKLADPGLKDASRLQLAKYYFAKEKMPFDFTPGNKGETKTKGENKEQRAAPEESSEEHEEVFVVSEEEEE